MPTNLLKGAIMAKTFLSTKASLDNGLEVIIRYDNPNLSFKSPVVCSSSVEPKTSKTDSTIVQFQFTDPSTGIFFSINANDVERLANCRKASANGRDYLLLRIAPTVEFSVKDFDKAELAFTK